MKRIINIILMAYTPVYTASLALLLWVSKHHRHYYARAKGLSSLLFFIAALIAYTLGNRANQSAFLLLIGALAFCAVGDILLGVANRSKKVRARPFISGALSFSVAHILFCVMLYTFSPPIWYDLLFPLLAAGIIFLLQKQELVKFRSKVMCLIAYCYTVLVSLMATKALQIGPWFAGSTLYNWFVAAGSISFFVSDFILLFLYFGTKRSKYLRYANLSSYYIGIYLLALSAYWL